MNRESGLRMLRSLSGLAARLTLVNRVPVEVLLMKTVMMKRVEIVEWSGAKH